ncbi:putative dihydrolipoyllysine-residue acetyltransferase [Helianthus annuus]|nr:putative dihydrolipoyllysine-residue acetyltransferase [Helianthus annuus]
MLTKLLFVTDTRSDLLWLPCDCVQCAKLSLDLYLLSEKWKELVEKARSKQLQPHGCISLKYII